MTDRYAWLAGADAKFLERLPVWDEGVTAKSASR